MSYNQQLGPGYKYYEPESTEIYDNESVLQDVGEYVLSPNDIGNNPNSESVLQDVGEYVLPPNDIGNNPNRSEPQTPEAPRQSHRQVIEDEYDENHYSLARPNDCPTERHGAPQHPTLETKPPRKEGMFNKKNAKIGAVVVACVVMVGGLEAMAIVLTDQTGIANIFYFV